MRLYYTIGIAIFVLVTKLKYVKCSHHLEPYYEREIDFAEIVREVAVNDPSAGETHLSEDLVQSPVSEKMNGHFSGNTFENIQPDSDSFYADLENLARSNVNEASVEDTNTEQETPSTHHETESVISNSDDSNKVSDKHHIVEEIILIRRADSEENDPIPKLIEQLTHNIKSPSELEESHRDDTNDETSPAFENSDIADGCPIHTETKLQQTCQSGPEYKVRFHNMYAANLKRDMESMLPEEKDSKCNFKNTGPVEDRALCPFTWNVSNYNPARIPPYLYNASCSCTVSRPIPDMLECVPIKKAIPVLWEVGCDGKEKKYKPGWEEITVACVPLETRISEGVRVFST